MDNWAVAFPNPSGSPNVRWNLKSAGYKIEIYDILGRRIMEIASGKGSGTARMSKLRSGVYLLVILSPNGTPEYKQKMTVIK